MFVLIALGLLICFVPQVRTPLFVGTVLLVFWALGTSILGISGFLVVLAICSTVVWCVTQSKPPQERIYTEDDPDLFDP